MKRSALHTSFSAIVLWLMILTAAPVNAQETPPAFQSADSLSMRSVPDSTANRLRNEKAFRYANDPSFWQKKPQRQTPDTLTKLFLFLQKPLVKVILYCILGLLILYILYQVTVVNNLFIFSKSARKKKGQQEEEIEALADDLDLQIEKAIAENDFRLAVRYLYLKTLRSLDDKQLIRLHARSTNHDYLQQMKKSPDAESFSFLTKVYEYVWYGEFEPDSKQFEAVNKKFNYFIR